MSQYVFFKSLSLIHLRLFPIIDLVTHIAIPGGGTHFHISQSSSSYPRNKFTDNDFRLSSSQTAVDGSQRRRALFPMQSFNFDDSDYSDYFVDTAAGSRAHRRHSDTVPLKKYTSPTRNPTATASTSETRLLPLSKASPNSKSKIRAREVTPFPPSLMLSESSSPPEQDWQRTLTRRGEERGVAPQPSSSPPLAQALYTRGSVSLNDINPRSPPRKKAKIKAPEGSVLGNILKTTEKGRLKGAATLGPSSRRKR